MCAFVATSLVFCILPLLAAGHDKFVGVFLGRTGLSTAGDFAVSGLWTFRTATLTPFTTTVWMVDGIHGRTANSRSNTEPTRTSRLADTAELVLFVRNGTDGRPTILRNLADFA